MNLKWPKEPVFFLFYKNLTFVYETLTLVELQIANNLTKFAIQNSTYDFKENCRSNCLLFNNVIRFFTREIHAFGNYF